jgi:triacylglycerol lipase
MGTRTGIRIIVALAVVAGLGVIGTPAAPPAAASAQATSAPTVASVVVDDWLCKPTAAHPSPVVLVHGTFSSSWNLLDRLALRIREAGHCVFAIDYGTLATGPIEDSAAELKTYVGRVLAATGAAKLSMVGHSQGGMMPRYYLKFLGGAAKVDDLVGLAAPNHGSVNPLLLTPGLGQLCRACAQQRRGSAFLRRLNRGDETPGRVSYTNIVTRYDEVVLPHTSGYLSGPRSTNVRLQDRCPRDRSGHLRVPENGPAIRLVLDALNRPGPARPAYRPSCLP